MANLLATIATSPDSLPALPSPGDLIGMFLSGRNPRTMTAYGRDLDEFARFVNATARRAAVESLLSAGQGPANAWALAWRNEMAGRGLTPATIARRLAALRSVVKLARTVGRVTWGLDVESPRSEPYRDTSGPGTDCYRAMLTVVQGDAAGGVASGLRDVALLRCLHDLGLRCGEAVSLDVGDVDLDGPTVAVVGKGKAQASRLTLPVPTRRALADWIEARGTISSRTPLFVRLDRAADDAVPGRLTGDGVRRIIDRVARRAGVGATVRPHGLRHLAVTEALDATRGDYRKVMKFSRHAKVETILRYDDNRLDQAGEVAGMIAGD